MDIRNWNFVVTLAEGSEIAATKSDGLLIDLTSNRGGWRQFHIIIARVLVKFPLDQPKI